MSPQPQMKVAVDVAKAPAWIPATEVITPTFEMPVQSHNQFAHGQEVLLATDHLPQVLPFARHRLFRRVHAQETRLPANVVPLKTKGVAQKIQTLPCFAQLQHASFLAVHSQS